GARNPPLQLVIHPELRQPITRVEDQRDDGGAHTVEDRGHGRQPSQAHVQCPERGHKDEIRKNECPTSGPGSPKSSPQVTDEDADLDREGPGQRLADGDPLQHLLPGHPSLLLHQLLFHLPAEGHRTSEAERAEAQEVARQIPDGYARSWILSRRSAHRDVFPEFPVRSSAARKPFASSSFGPTPKYWR